VPATSVRIAGIRKESTWTYYSARGFVIPRLRARYKPARKIFKLTHY